MVRYYVWYSDSGAPIMVYHHDPYKWVSTRFNMDTQYIGSQSVTSVDETNSQIVTVNVLVFRQEGETHWKHDSAA